MLLKNDSADNDFELDTLVMNAPGGEKPIEGDLRDDEEDEDFDDQAADLNDLHEIQVDDDLGEPDPEDDDHLPDDDLQ